jgi:hypothetical protein
VDDDCARIVHDDRQINPATPIAARTAAGERGDILLSVRVLTKSYSGLRAKKHGDSRLAATISASHAGTWLQRRLNARIGRSHMAGRTSFF